MAGNISMIRGDMGGGTPSITGGTMMPPPLQTQGPQRDAGSEAERYRMIQAMAKDPQTQQGLQSIMKKFGGGGSGAATGMGGGALSGGNNSGIAGWGSYM